MLSLLAFFLILFNLLIIINTPTSNGYEASIYDQYPLIFWFCIVLTYLISIVGLFIICHCKIRIIHAIKFIISFFITNFILISLSVIRGYFINENSDVLTHIGYINDILNSGTFYNNYYPFIHILAVIIEYFSGLSIYSSILITPALFFFIFFLFINFIGKMTFNSEEEKIILIILSSILLFRFGHIYFLPNSAGFFIFPIIVYLCLKINNISINTNFILLLVIFCFSMMFYHPLVTLMTIIFLILLYVNLLIFTRKNNTKTYILSMILVTSILFLSWNIILSILTHTLKLLLYFIAGEPISTSEFQYYTSFLSYNIGYFNIIKYVIFNYGTQVILSGITFLFICLIFSNTDEKEQNINNIFIWGFLIYLLLSIILFFTNGTFGFIRIISFSLFFSLLIIPTFLIKASGFAENIKIMKYFKIFMVILLILMILIISIFSLYPSNISRQSNRQVTISDYSGMEFFLKNRDITIGIIEYGVSQLRYHDAIYGVNYEKININYGENTLVVKNFGYSSNTTLYDSYKNPKYLLLNQQGIHFGENIFPEFKNQWRISPNDMFVFSNDNTVNNVYNNKNLMIYLIKPSK